MQRQQGKGDTSTFATDLAIQPEQSATLASMRAKAQNAAGKMQEAASEDPEAGNKTTSCVTHHATEVADAERMAGETQSGQATGDGQE